MRTYKRINEEYLELIDQNEYKDELSMNLDANVDMLLHDRVPNIDFNLIQEPIYKVDDDTFLKILIKKCTDMYGYDCNLNWIDVSHIDNMAWLFSTSMFNGDISCWDVSRVTNMNCMFHRSNFDSDISKWNTACVKTMYQMFWHSSFNYDISGWNVSRVTNHVDMFKGCPIKEEFKPHGFRDELPNKK